VPISLSGVPALAKAEAKEWRRSWMRKSGASPAAFFARAQAPRRPSSGLPGRRWLGNTYEFEPISSTASRPALALSSCASRDQFPLARPCYSGSVFLDNADELVDRRERQWPLEIRITAATNETIGEPCTRGEHLDADFARARSGTHTDHDTLRPSAGSRNWKMAPCGRLGLAHNWPPWTSMIVLQIESPMPIPLDFVV
jgi:hypothetical protein